MGYIPNAGEKCQVIIPVDADFATMKEHATVVRDQATESLHRICQQQGFTPVDQELIWSGSVAAARNTPHARSVSHIPDGYHLFIFEAIAA